MNEQNAGKLRSFWQKIGPMLGYNTASILFGGGGYIISLYFLSFLTEVEKLSVDQAGMVIAVAHIWDAVTDPVMGIITDRTRSKYGRHRRYLLWGVIPIAVSYFCLWNSFGISASGNTTATMIYYMCAYMLYNTALTLVSVPHVAMLPVIAPEYSLRTQYNSVQYIMNSVGMVSSFLSVSLSLGFTNMEMSAASRPKFMFFGAVLCLWFSLPLLVTFKCTKEPSSLDMKLPPFNARTFIGEYRQVFRNKAFRRYFVLSSMYTMAKGFYANSDQYFIKYIAQRFGYFNTLQTIAGAAEASGFPVNYIMTMKKGKQLCGKILTPIMAIGIAMNLFIGSKTPLWVTIVATVLYNFGFSGPGFTATNIQPDVTDVDEMITGRRREGVISTFNTLIKKTINGLMSAVTGFILKGFGFRTGAEGANALYQTPSGVFGLRFTFCILPLIFVALVYFCVFTYKMTQEDHRMILEAIKEKKETGKCTLTPEQRKRCEEISGQKFGDMWIGKPAADTLVTES